MDILAKNRIQKQHGAISARRAAVAFILKNVRQRRKREIKISHVTVYLGTYAQTMFMATIHFPSDSKILRFYLTKQ